MTRTQRALVAGVCGMLFALVLLGCDGGGDGAGGDDGASDPAGFPDVRGAYTGTFTYTNSGCTTGRHANGTETGPGTFTITRQNGADFRGVGDFGAVIVGQVTADGDVSSTWTASPGPDAWGETHIGTLTGDTWTDEISGRYTAGDTCVYVGETTATRQ
jgi:hypothetical protein